MHTIDAFFNAYLAAFPPRTVYTANVPAAMMAAPVDQEGWFSWQLLPGTLQAIDYKQLEKEHAVKLPRSFVDWHRAYYFLDGDCSLVRLPESNPNQPLQALRQEMNWQVAESLIAQRLYPFASEGNDTGPLLFDGRQEMLDNEFPIRVYDHEFWDSLDGLSPVIFSSFSKLLECLTHFLTETQTRKRFEVIPDFLTIDPLGAGSTGVDYWLQWAAMEKGNYEEFGA